MTAAGKRTYMHRHARCTSMHGHAQTHQHTKARNTQKEKGLEEEEDRVLTDGRLIHGWFVQGPFFQKKG